MGSCLLFWIPACAGMTLGGLARPRPGHTPRARFACTRPFRWERKGQGVVVCASGGSTADCPSGWTLSTLGRWVWVEWVC